MKLPLIWDMTHRLMRREQLPLIWLPQEFQYWVDWTYKANKDYFAYEYGTWRMASWGEQLWMRHVPYQWIISRINEWCDIGMSHVIYGRIMSLVYESCHIWMSHVTYEWVMSQMNESCHIWMSHVTYEWVMSHVNESCHTLNNLWRGATCGMGWLWLVDSLIL